MTVCSISSTTASSPVKLTSDASKQVVDDRHRPDRQQQSAPAPAAPGRTPIATMAATMPTAVFVITVKNRTCPERLERAAAFRLASSRPAAGPA
jgi:hypothetical protein